MLFQFWDALAYWHALSAFDFELIHTAFSYVVSCNRALVTVEVDNQLYLAACQATYTYCCIEHMRVAHSSITFPFDK